MQDRTVLTDDGVTLQIHQHERALSVLEALVTEPHRHVAHREDNQ